MVIKYIDKKLEKSLSNDRVIKKIYGRLSNRIIEVLDEMDVALNLSQIPECPPDRRHKMTNEQYVWSIDLNKNYRMWVQSEGYDDPKQVETITIIRIFDDH